MEVYPDGCELVWRRVFPGQAEHARSARDFVAFLLADLSTLDDAMVVTGEFVANALRHTASARPGGQFLVEVRRRFNSTTITLIDQGGPSEPSIPDLDNLSECGRGLYMAQALAGELTWSGGPAGRAITATFKDGAQ